MEAQEMHQKPTNTIEQTPSFFDPLVRQWFCSVCGKQMKSDKGFEGLTCENGHKIGTLTDEGTPIKASMKRETP